jgi:hypothetical protein
MQRLATLVATLFLVACETVDTHTIARGPVWLVTRDDIRAAIAAARQGEPRLRTATVHQVIVHSRDEILVVIGYTGEYGAGAWAVVRRSGGTWRYINSGGMVVIASIRPNQTMELTATRRTTMFYVTSTTSSAAIRAPGRSSSSCSR